MKRNIIPFLIILSLSTCFLFPMVVDSRYYDYETLLHITFNMHALSS